MSQELTVTGSVSFAKGRIGTVVLEKLGLKINVAGSSYARGTFVTSGDTPIPLGDVVAAGAWFIIFNNDATHAVGLHGGASYDQCMVIQPGEFAMGRFDLTGVTAPCVAGGVNTVPIEYLVISA